MTLLEYIKNYYDNSPYWFKDECLRPYHIDRIQNIIAIKQYLNGKHKIMSRPDEQYNGRTFKTRKIILQYAKTILNFETAFLLKNPITLISNDADTLKVYKDIYSKSRYNILDYKILDKLVKYGQCYEYLYIDGNNIKSKIIDAADAYPVYDDMGNYIAFIEHYTIEGISYWNVFDDNTVTSWTDLGGDMHKIGEYKNISGLPIVYKTNNEEDELQGRSDLEDYISILDNMEELLSKYADAFYKFLNPVPVVTGTKLNIGKNGEGAISPDVVGYVLQLDDGSKFELVTNRMDYKSLEVLYNTLKQALLDVSMTPAITMNSQEISNLSEVSIKLLFNLAEIKGGLNSMYLKDGFIQRWEKIKKLLSIMDINVAGDIDCTFEMAIPQNAKEVIENLKTLRDINAISLDTLLANSPYVYDVEGEKEKILNNITNDIENK